MQRDNLGPPQERAAPREAWSKLVLGVIGVVYGDIGTSPLYAFRECFAGAHPLEADPAHVLAVLSLIFWAVTAVVSVKYLAFVIRADNEGQGGSLALIPLVTRMAEGRRLAPYVVLLGIAAAGLFYGDSMLTPAISVLSAVEGLEVVAPALDAYVVPLAFAILLALFLVQRRGSTAIGRLFGPVMCLWFLTLAALGAVAIAAEPRVLAALDPRHAVRFFATEPWAAFLALSSVVLVVTGAEALYVDIGHFGRRPIRVAWFSFVLPALLLNYFGQGALLLREPGAIANPFYHLAPSWLLVPLVVLATAATVIASQAVISGTFSVTRQAIQLGLLPRMTIVHTSEQAMGQVYVPFANWMLLVAVAALVLGFGSSSDLAAAYGVAVTGTMTIDSILFAVVVLLVWRWNRFVAALLIALFLAVDLAFLAANVTKLGHGGWFAVAVAAAALLLLTTWRRGRLSVFQRLGEDSIPVETFLGSLSARVQRVPGMAVFLTGWTEGVPHSLLHNLKHNKVLHERVLLLTVRVEPVPRVDAARRLASSDLGQGLHRVLLSYGFMDDIDVPAALAGRQWFGRPFDLMETSFFIGRETVIPTERTGMALWREHVFAWMARSAANPMTYFRLPANRVVELGSQIEI